MIALSEWPKTGVPDNPGAWLMAAAKRRAIDSLRRNRMLARKHEEIGRDLEDERDTGVEDLEAAMDDDVGDELLSLIFIACHPVLSAEARAALTLRLIGGLTTDEIARAFLVQRSDHRPAHRPRQAHARRCRPELRAAARQGAGAASRLGAGGHLPDLQRGLCRHRRRGPDPPGAVRRGPAPRPHPGRRGIRRARGLRPARADGNPGVASARPHRAGRRAGAPDRAEPRPLGPAADPPRPRRPATRRGPGRRPRTVRAAGRDRRLPRARAQIRRTRTGRG